MKTKEEYILQRKNIGLVLENKIHIYKIFDVKHSSDVSFGTNLKEINFLNTKLLELNHCKDEYLDVFEQKLINCGY